jgi:predicted ribosomally synthesized peptide with nif11-like leader
MTSNLQAFFEKVAQDPELQNQLNEIAEKTPEQLPARTIEISQSIGLPVTIEDLQLLKAAKTGELSEEDLSAVAGGGVVDFLKKALPIMEKIATSVVPVVCTDVQNLIRR